MPRLLLLLAIAIALYILFLRARSLPPHKRRGEYLKLGLAVTVVVVVYLTLTGRMHWVGAALTGLLVGLRQLLPLLIRYFPMLASLRQQHAGASSGSGSAQSTVETATLRMHLDHESGELSGEVLQGPWREWQLAEMDREQLEELRRYCTNQDSEALQLLDSYLQQRFPGASFEDSEPPPETGDGGDGLSRAEALAVLGLGEGASREEIIAAHRRLMQKLHPDRGGNDYLAAKINEAKDFLLD